MRSRLNSLGFRITASATLMVWLSAVTLCLIHCNFKPSAGHDGEARSCHSSKAASHEDPSGRQNDHGEQSAFLCGTIKSALSSAQLTSPVLPAFILYSLPGFVLSLPTPLERPIASVFRQDKERNRALTPEVYLGPANKSQAPPALLA